MVVVQLRHDTEGRAYYRRKRAAGKTSMEAMRALKRRLCDVVYRQLVADQRRGRDTGRPEQASPGGQAGAATGSSAADSNPNAGASEKSRPGPASTDPTPATAAVRSSRRSRRRQTTPARSRRQAHSA
jgi:hypothetical protein